MCPDSVKEKHGENPANHVPVCRPKQILQLAARQWLTVSSVPPWNARHATCPADSTARVQVSQYSSGMGLGGFEVFDSHVSNGRKQQAPTFLRPRVHCLCGYASRRPARGRSSTVVCRDSISDGGRWRQAPHRVGQEHDE